MKNVTKIILLLLLPFSALCQDTLYSLHIDKARLLVRDALRAQVLDSLNEEKTVQISMMGKEYSHLQVKMGEMKLNFEKRLALYEDSYKVLVTTNQGLREEVRQVRRANVGWKIGTGLGAAAAIYFAAKAAGD